MHLVGQMVHLPESSSILFLGSPTVEKLEELIGNGIYLSDIPIHDATRDVLLIGEQTKAQVHLFNQNDTDSSVAMIFFQFIILKNN